MNQFALSPATQRTTDPSLQYMCQQGTYSGEVCVQESDSTNIAGLAPTVWVLIAIALVMTWVVIKKRHK